MGYYVTVDRQWPESDAPRCTYCGRIAAWDMLDPDALLCDDPRCHTAYIEVAGWAIEFTDEPVLTEEGG